MNSIPKSVKKPEANATDVSISFTNHHRRGVGGVSPERPGSPGIQYISLVCPAPRYENDLFIATLDPPFTDGEYDLKDSLIAITEYWSQDGTDHKVQLKTGTVKLTNNGNSLEVHIDASGEKDDKKVKVKGHFTAKYDN